MNVLIIYDSLHLLIKAKALIQSAVENTGLNIPVKTKSWRLGQLELFSPNQEVRNDAHGAHLIIFGCDHVNSFPPGVEDWLEQWALERNSENVALAVISEDERTRSFISNRVSQFSQQKGLDFLPVGQQMTGNSGNSARMEAN